MPIKIPAPTVDYPLFLRPRQFAVDNLRYFDSDNPSSLIAAPAIPPTQHKEVVAARVCSSLWARMGV
jgi:hypothetical protein